MWLAFSGRLPHNEQAFDISILWKSLILIAVTSGIVILLISIGAVVARLWRINWQFPTWRSNPFWPLDPLQQFHVVAFILIITGALIVVRHVASGLNGSSGILIIDMGVGVLVGDYLSAAMFLSRNWVGDLTKKP